MKFNDGSNARAYLFPLIMHTFKLTTKTSIETKIVAIYNKLNSKNVKTKSDDEACIKVANEFENYCKRKKIIISKPKKMNKEKEEELVQKSRAIILAKYK